MIPILYEKDETSFLDNGLGRLRDCVSCLVTEERNGIYELDFEYPISGQHFDKIQIGRIVAVEHDDSGDVQPFDIVGYEKPIEGVVTFHCTHISYRQSYLTVTGSNISSLANAFTRLKNYATPSNPFTYWTDKTSTGYVGAFDGVPKSVRSILGGTEGSILDAYGGEYEWDRFTVRLWAQRGEYRDFAIRYGVNMMDYLDETDSSECYSSIIPYWTDGTTTVVGDKQTASGLPPSGRDACVPMDVSEKFENQPTKAQVNTAGASIVNSGQPYLPTQNITVSFVRLQDTEEYMQFANLLRCGLCDSINVIFPDYNNSGNFKIVKTVWDVLDERYIEMELGSLSVSLSQALGIGQSQSNAGGGGILEFYPIGSYYETSKTQAEFDPNIAWGGTWVLENAGYVHVSGGTGYAVSGADGDSGKGTKDGGNTTSSVPTTTLTDANIAHGHGHSLKLPDHQHHFNNSRKVPGLADSATWGSTKVASGTSTSAYYINRGTASLYTVVQTDNPDTNPAITGSVSNLSGASSTRTAHGHGSVSTMQPHINVYRWHRTA